MPSPGAHGAGDHRAETPDQAQRSADDALGSDAMLLERYAHQRELQSWMHKWRAGYVLAPLLGFSAVFTMTILALIAISNHLPAALHHTRIPALSPTAWIGWRACCSCG